MKTVYILRERFERAYGDLPPAVKTQAIHAFATLEEAQAAKERLEREEIERTNPFFTGDSLADWTSLSETELRQRLRRADVKAPGPGSTDDAWPNWGWNLSHLTPAQFTVLRHALDRVEFYALEEQTVPTDSAVRGKAYVVQRLDWQYNDSWHDLGNDEPVKAFRDRERAEAYRRELEMQSRTQQIVNAGLFGGGVLERISSLSAAEMRQRLAELGLTPPQNDDYRDHRWWATLTGRFAYLAQPVRDLFDRVRWYDVVEIEVDP